MLFQHFPLRWYPFQGGAKKKLLTNITRKVALTKEARNLEDLYIDIIVDGKSKPEEISDFLYGSMDYFWVLLFVNNIHHIPTEWPMADDELENYILEKYNITKTELSTVHHWENEFGDWIDPMKELLKRDNPVGHTRDAVAVELGLTPVTVEQYEIEVNEGKKHLKAIAPAYIEVFSTSIQEAFEEEVSA